MHRKIHAEICRNLYDFIFEEPLKLDLLAFYPHAVDFCSEEGMVTILAQKSHIQPFSIRVPAVSSFCDENILHNHLLLNAEGIQDENGVFWIGFSSLESFDLRMLEMEPPGKGDAEAIRRFLQTRKEGGLHAMIEGCIEDPFIEYIFPRIDEFRRTYRDCSVDDARSVNNLIDSVNHLAGCGPGLTPSADDFLSGYLAFQPEDKDSSSITSMIIDAAVKKTNKISGSLLKRTEERLFSQAVIELGKSFGSDYDRIQRALKHVAEFGSSSGCDFLTGVYYGISDADIKGGQYCEKVGSQEKRVLRFSDVDDHLQGSEKNRRCE